MNKRIAYKIVNQFEAARFAGTRCRHTPGQVFRAYRIISRDMNWGGDHKIGSRIVDVLNQLAAIAPSLKYRDNADAANFKRG